MPFFRPHRKTAPGAAQLGSTPTAITRRALDSALASAASAFPNEFGGVLRADPPGVISDLLLVPGGTAGRRHANFHLYMLPADLTIVGTVHSHPSGALRPSDADLQLFRSWGRRHLILGAPYDPGCWRAYDGNGAETRLAVVGAGTAGPAGPLRSYRGRAPLPERREPLVPLDDEP
ncbi:MAG TPA: Mov34/MPN/PAD-1 family protein [Thermoplasmata archaeon]|nr:Mov34/MPN/PAD-1 family protein [Thermoplasmata archaeon]